jgi:hypothetical protein
MKAALSLRTDQQGSVEQPALGLGSRSRGEYAAARPTRQVKAGVTLKALETHILVEELEVQVWAIGDPIILQNHRGGRFLFDCQLGSFNTWRMWP